MNFDYLSAPAPLLPSRSPGNREKEREKKGRESIEEEKYWKERIKREKDEMSLLVYFHLFIPFFLLFISSSLYFQTFLITLTHDDIIIPSHHLILFIHFLKSLSHNWFYLSLKFFPTPTKFSIQAYNNMY